MDELTLHIRYLLQHHDCVIVPGIGAFLSRNVPARLCEDGSILAPARECCFNSSIRIGDELLANSIARRRHVGFSEGRRQLQQAVADMQHALEEDGEVRIPAVGTLRVGNEGQYVFEPGSAVSDQSRQRGFLTYRPMEKQAEVEEKIIRKDLSPCVKKEAEKWPRQDADFYYFRLPKALTHAAAVFIAVIAIGLAVVIPGLDTPANVYKASMVPIGKLFPAAAAPKVVAVVPKATPQETAVTPDAPEYHLIVATFHAREAAERFISQNPDMQGQLRILPGSRVFRIAVASADTKENLQAERPAYSSRFPEAWIHHQKLD